MVIQVCRPSISDLQMDQKRCQNRPCAGFPLNFGLLMEDSARHVLVGETSVDLTCYDWSQ